ncbi:MAG TPA: hypothetical protein VFC73_02095 [Syntrophomonadaceae bacterium]|nr:hypothetical protein [Syntrophomonadaceae bacterium]
MLIKPGEQTLLAYFSDYKLAKKTLLILEEHGFTDIHIDPINYFKNTKINKRNSLSSLVCGYSEYNNSFGSLLAADPIVSGMSSIYETHYNYSYVLVMIVDNSTYLEAVNIIRQNGGRI